MSSKPSHRSWLSSRTLAFRLATAYSLVGLLLVILATASLYLVLRAELERSTEQFLSDKLHVLSTMLLERPNDDDGLHEEIELENAARRYQQFYIRLLDENGRPIMTTPGMAENIDFIRFPSRTQGNTERSIALAGKDGRPFRVTSAVVQVGDSNHHDIVQIAIDVTQEEELLARFRLWFWGILLTTSALFPFVGYRIARHGIRPVEEIGETARRITSTNLRERIHSAGYPSELALLAETFNAMLERLEESFERISRFTADIAHDLRTPVNNIRGEVEVALARTRTPEEYRDVLESSLEEAVRLSELIGDLLFLTRAENPSSELRRDKKNIQDLLNKVRDYYEASAIDKGVLLVTKDQADPLPAEFDHSLMLRAVSNLVSNAIVHTPRGGMVTLSATRDDGSICIEVSDTGIGIPAEALPRVFDRFFRVDPSRSKKSGGTGLGLAIVQSILTLHEGSAKISSKPDQGTIVSLRIPA